MRVACIGEAMVELSTGGTNPALGVAGDTLNTAIYMKRAAPTIQVDFITRLGSDPFSDNIRHFIAEQDIGTQAIETSSDRIPGLYAITTIDGERSFTYWRDQSAARQMFQTESGYDFTALDAYDAIYLSGITLAILPDPSRQGLLDAAQGKTLIFDSNYRPRLWADQATAQHWTRAFWKAADIALPSVDDEMALFDETTDEVALRFLELPGTGALKRGETGPLSLGPDVQQTYPPAPQVIDTTAAGDSFNGAYLAALLSGASQAKALLEGHACAAHVVQHRGAIAPKQRIS